MAERAGLVLIELLIVLLLFSLVGVWASQRLTTSLAADARWIASVITQARARALVAGTATTVIGGACTPQPILALEGRTSAKLSAPNRGLQFDPAGLPRTCDGGGVGNTTILLEYRGRQAAVIVSSLGRVRWEMR